MVFQDEFQALFLSSILVLILTLKIARTLFDIIGGSFR